MGSSETRVLGSSTPKLDDRATVEHSTVGTHPLCGTSSGCILAWCLGAVHEFIDTWAARRNSGPGHEKAADAGLVVLLLDSDNSFDPRALGFDQCGEQCAPDFGAQHNNCQLFSVIQSSMLVHYFACEARKAL